MHKAANALSEEIILILVERNPAVTSVTNNKGQTCLDLLEQRGKQAG